MNLSLIFKMVVLSSAVASLVTIIIFIIKVLFKNKINATWQYYIWFFLIIRLIVPTGFETPFSKFNKVNIINERTGVYEKLSNYNNSNEKSNIKDTNKVLKSNENNNLKQIEYKDMNYYVNALSKVWIIGAIFIAFTVLFMNFIFLFRLRNQPICKDENTIKILKKCKSIMKTRKFIPIVYNKDINTPALLGVFKPKILFNQDLIYNLTDKEKKYIFLHELSHFKRKDIVISWIIIFLIIINWFNPLIWLAFYKMREDSELACDAYVLSYLEEKEHIAYGETIIQLVNLISNVKWMPGTTGIIKKKSNIKRRIIMIKNFKNQYHKGIIVSISLLVAIAMIGVTNLPIKAQALNNDTGLIEAKQGDAASISIVKGFLPKDAQIVFDSVKKTNDVLVKDLNNDGENEIIAAYKLSGQDKKINILVLKKSGNKWNKALDESGEGYKIESVLAADIDGDGEEEILLSRRIGGTVCSLSVYKWNNSVLNKILKEDLYYSKLDVVNIPEKNMKAIATWQHDTGNAYIVDVLKWNGKDFTSAEELYNNYFKQQVVPYYEQKVKEMPKAGFYWYYLSDAQIKAGDKKSALKSIEKGISLNSGYPSVEEFNKLKEKASK